MAGAAGLVAARGRRLPELGPLDLLLLAADTDKLSRLLAKDAVTSPIRFGPTSPELHKRSEVDLHYRANPERI
jgi:hypothetical protein